MVNLKSVSALESTSLVNSPARAASYRFESSGRQVSKIESRHCPRRRWLFLRCSKSLVVSPRTPVEDFTLIALIHLERLARTRGSCGLGRLSRKIPHPVYLPSQTLQ